MSFAHRLRRLGLESLERRECLTATVEQVANINTMSSFVEIRNSIVAGSFFYLMAAQKDSSLQLWRTGGTTESTIALADLSLATSFSMANVNGILYFAGSTAETGQELWRTDGTVGGTGLVKDLAPGSAQY